MRCHFFRCAALVLLIPSGMPGGVLLAVDIADCNTPFVLEPVWPVPGAEGIGRNPFLDWELVELAGGALRGDGDHDALEKDAVKSGNKVVFGDDDRLDWYQVEDDRLLAAADSTVALVNQSDLCDNGNGTFDLPSTPLGEFELRAFFGPFDEFFVTGFLCDSEPFGNQPAAAYCSGFLVGPDLIATAGHCLTPSADCQTEFMSCFDVAIVFGYKMAAADRAITTIDASQVYVCDDIVDARFECFGADYALIRLDRPVPDHAPLQLRSEGKISNNQAVVSIGYPVGLPIKIAGGAQVIGNQDPSCFEVNTDTFNGNSGSPIFNASTMEVEGILVAGSESDFRPHPTDDCVVTHRCPPLGGCGPEFVTRIAPVVSSIPEPRVPVEFDILFGPCGQETFRATVSDSPWKPSEDLEPGVTYCWQVGTRSECGQVPGPTWRFTTTPQVSRFRRGDANASGSVDISDPLASLKFQFLGACPNECPTPCMDALDVDNSGAVDINDPLANLRFQFLGVAPAEGVTLGICALDAPGDDLRCATFVACP